MNTTERIVEAVKKQLLKPFPVGLSSEVVETLLPDIRIAIASVIWKERPKIDLNEIEKLVQYKVNTNADNLSKWYEKSQEDQNLYADTIRSRIGYTLSDLTPKTKEDETNNV